MAHRIPLIGDKSTVVIQMSERVSDRKKKKTELYPILTRYRLLSIFISMFTLPKYQRFFKERLLRDELDTETQSFRWRATYIDSLYWGGMKVYKLLKLVYSISPTNNGILIILSLAETTSRPEVFFYRYSTIFHRMNCNSWKRTSESFCDRGLVSFHLELSSMLNEFASRG